MLHYALPEYDLPDYGNLNSNMETITVWLVYQAIIRSIRDYYAAFSDVDDILDRTIHEENNIINGTISGNRGVPFHMEQAMPL
jgi:hypothetical protein